MPHSLRAKLKYLTICGHIRKKDYERLCKALDNEGVLDKIKAEIENERVSCAMGLEIYYNEAIDDVLRIIDKYKGDTKYAVKVVAHGNCMNCGKELTEGIFFCKECMKKAEGEG